MAVSTIPVDKSQSMTLFPIESKPVTTSMAYVGISFTLTRTSVVYIRENYNQAAPKGVAIYKNSAGTGSAELYAKDNDGYLSGVLPAGTYYVFASANAAGNNNFYGTYLPI